MSIYHNRYILIDDPYIATYTTYSGREFNFLKMQEEGKRSWHSRPYEYKYMLDIINIIPWKEDIDILDLGCGVSHPGYSMLGDLPKVRNIVAIDMDQRLYSNGIDHPKVEKVVGDIVDYKTGHKFDIITCISTLEHIRDNIEEVLGKTWSLLRGGGILVLTLDIYHGNSKTPPHNLDYRRPSDYIRNLDRVGFHLLEKSDVTLPERAVSATSSKFPLKGAGSDKDYLKAFRLTAVK